MNVSLSKFIKKFLALMSIQVFIALSFFLLVPAGNNNFWSQSLTEKRKLLETVDAPRIIFLGGSSSALGIDSATISKSLNISVINEGLHAGVGLKNLLLMVKPYICQGDIIVIIPEYELYELDYEGGISGETRSVAGLIEVAPSLVTTFDLSQFSKLPNIIPVVIQIKFERALDRIIHSQQDSVYSAPNLYNEYGDFTSHLGLSFDGKIPDSPFLSEDIIINPKAIRLLNDFNAFAKEHGAQTFLAFPPGRQTNCNATKLKDFQNLYDGLAQSLSFPVLSEPLSSCYPDEYFYDTQYHLNIEGRSFNSQRLIRLLLPILLP